MASNWQQKNCCSFCRTPECSEGSAGGTESLQIGGTFWITWAVNTHGWRYVTGNACKTYGVGARNYVYVTAGSTAPNTTMYTAPNTTTNTAPNMKEDNNCHRHTHPSAYECQIAEVKPTFYQRPLDSSMHA